MTADTMMVQTKQLSPRLKARIAGVYYLLTFVSGALSLVFANGRNAANLVATVCYVAVTVLFYELFKPVNARLSLLAAAFSAAGCATSALAGLNLPHLEINSLAFFGGYCLLIGILIVRSTFLPRVLGVLMIAGGLGWLTFLSPSLAHALNPWNMAPGIIGEGALTVWLVAKGVDATRWNEAASAEMGVARPARRSPGVPPDSGDDTTLLTH